MGRLRERFEVDDCAYAPNNLIRGMERLELRLVAAG